MTTAEAALALGISRGRVHHFISKGRLHAVRRGRDYWLEPEEVARFKALPRPQGWRKGQKRAPTNPTE